MVPASAASVASDSHFSWYGKGPSNSSFTHSSLFVSAPLTSPILILISSFLYSVKRGVVNQLFLPNMLLNINPVVIGFILLKISRDVIKSTMRILAYISFRQSPASLSMRPV